MTLFSVMISFDWRFWVKYFITIGGPSTSWYKMLVVWTRAIALQTSKKFYQNFHRKTQIFCNGDESEVNREESCSQEWKSEKTGCEQKFPKSGCRMSVQNGSAFNLKMFSLVQLLVKVCVTSTSANKLTGGGGGGQQGPLLPQEKIELEIFLVTENT